MRTRDHGVTAEFIKAMKAEGFTGATLEEFVRLRDHGVTQQYIQEMKKAGFTSATRRGPGARARSRRHAGVRAGDSAGMGLGVDHARAVHPAARPRRHASRLRQVRSTAQGFKNVPLEDVVRTKDHGVSADYVADMKELGLKDLTLPQIVRLRDHGITPGFVNHARARGYKTDRSRRARAAEERRALEGLTCHSRRYAAG